MYEQISAEDAKKIMDSDNGVIILDVREREEFCFIINCVINVKKHSYIVIVKQLWEWI